MPKIVDHAARRDEIALVACRVVAEHGFENATVVRIAREAGYTTGMIAHYFDTKQEIILAALRLMLRRIEERLLRPSSGGESLLDVLSELMPVDAKRATESAFWVAFWGQMSADEHLRQINSWVHAEYSRLYERCLSEHWPEWATWPEEVRDNVLRAVSTGLNGLTASAVISPAEWPGPRQLEHMERQLTLWRDWARDITRAAVARSTAVPVRRRTTKRVTG
jgi:AcrR family transcriptional regulator